MEEWRSVTGYEGLYEVSSFGRVRNSRTGRILKPGNSHGHYRVKLCKKGKEKSFFVHRLVYETFCGEIAEGLVIDHVDGDKTNNNLENLRVCTQKENCNNPVTRPKLVEALKKLHSDPEFCKKNAEANRKAFGKSVAQLDKVSGEIIKLWECITDASRELGINQSTISGCCNGKRKSAGRFKWRFV